MSLLTTFILKKIIEELENEFISHEPELQKDFINEVAMVSEKIGNWVREKISEILPDGADK